MKRGFVVSAVLYPLLVIALALIMGLISMSDNRRKILDNMKLEVSEESESDPEMTNSTLYYKIKALEEAYGELNARFSEEYFDQIKADYESKIATAKTQAINSAKLQAFPVGSIFTSTTSTNPSSYIGGTWAAYGQGRTLVGIDTSQTEFNTINKTGGSKTHNHTGTVGETTLTISQIPSHDHNIPSLSGSTSETGSHNHAQSNYTWHSNNGSAGGTKIAISNGSGYGAVTGNWGTSTASDGNHSHTVTTNASTSGTTGGTGSHSHTVFNDSNMQPYITVYFWKRTT